MHADEEILASVRAGFQQEAQEMLAQFEQALLDLEGRPGDTEVMNSAFRAAHTIKGGAGLFGFEAVVTFTHEVESLLDAMRCGQRQLDEQVMGLLLQGSDQMKALVAAVDQDGQDATLNERSHVLGGQLRALLPTTAGESAPAAAPMPASAAPIASAAEPGVGAGQEPLWHISLQMGPDALRNGLDPLSFIRYLDTLGKVQGLRTLTHRLPGLPELDAEGCFLGFEIRYRTDADRAMVEGVFDFLQDDCDLVVLAPEASAQDYEALLQHRTPDGGAEREALVAHWQALAGPDRPAFHLQAAATSAAPKIAPPAVPAATATTHAPPAASVPAPAPTPTPAAAAAATPDAERRAGPRDRRAAEEIRFVRVRADKLDRLIDLIGELVIASSGAQLAAQTEAVSTFLESAQRIADLVEEARDGALSLRMVPIGETFSKFQRVVRDLSKQLGKEVELQITGGDTELDKSMVETISDPLMHLVRNSMDHGIEPVEERQAAGKPVQGRLAFHAYHESGSIVIEVSDDGRGLNRERILRKALERGLVPPDAAMDDDAVYQLIFLPGFSTAEQVTNVSGRGVGMDVVKRNIESLRGQIHVASTPGRGATMQIRLPLTLAMIDGFLTTVGEVHYVLPLSVVAECIDVPPEVAAEPERTVGNFDLRGEVLPYLDLARFYGVAPAQVRRRSVVVVRDGHLRIGLVVDRLLGEHQTVIKPLAGLFRHLKALAGSTILGSGAVALVLDLPGLVAAATRRPHAGGGSVPSPIHATHPEAH
ncbi:chemotaxis protein CheA [Ideonella livida]|uniref:Chemotaxis protein CheA n=1 Tax=Ideonella livida TaxID=2707176 RepID=A0A7C9TJ17_9BURK|nr:chemotaxis protein CheA [Ideonella livida]NDY91458.1 chemotaxis protein CheA [Ideonella livida]